MAAYSVDPVEHAEHRVEKPATELLIWYSIFGEEHPDSSGFFYAWRHGDIETTRVGPFPTWAAAQAHAYTDGLP